MLSRSDCRATAPYAARGQVLLRGLRWRDGYWWVSASTDGRERAELTQTPAAR